MCGQPLSQSVQSVRPVIHSVSRMLNQQNKIYIQLENNQGRGVKEGRKEDCRPLFPLVFYFIIPFFFLRSSFSFFFLFIFVLLLFPFLFSIISSPLFFSFSFSFLQLFFRIFVSFNLLCPRSFSFLLYFSFPLSSIHSLSTYSTFICAPNCRHRRYQHHYLLSTLFILPAHPILSSPPLRFSLIIHIYVHLRPLYLFILAHVWSFNSSPPLFSTCINNYITCSSTHLIDQPRVRPLSSIISLESLHITLSLSRSCAQNCFFHSTHTSLTISLHPSPFPLVFKDRFKAPPVH